MENIANSEKDQLLEGSEWGFSLSLSPHPSLVQAQNRVRSRTLWNVPHERFLFQFTATQFPMSPCGLGSVSFLTDHRTVQGQKGFHSPPENLLQAVLNPRPRLILYWKLEILWGRRSVFKQHFKCHFLFGRQLPNFGGDYFCVVAARSEPEPQSKTTLNKQPVPLLFTGNPPSYNVPVTWLDII